MGAPESFRSYLWDLGADCGTNDGVFYSVKDVVDRGTDDGGYCIIDDGAHASTEDGVDDLLLAYASVCSGYLRRRPGVRVDSRLGLPKHSCRWQA